MEVNKKYTLRAKDRHNYNGVLLQLMDLSGLRITLIPDSLTIEITPTSEGVEDRITDIKGCEFSECVITDTDSEMARLEEQIKDLTEQRNMARKSREDYNRYWKEALVREARMTECLKALKTMISALIHEKERPTS